jgi:hypothetical protein
VQLDIIRVDGGKDGYARPHPEPTMLIVLQGRATLLDGDGEVVQQGDTVTVPAGRQYGFRSAGPTAFEALHVIFSSKEPARTGHLTVAGLFAHNNARAAALLQTRYFQLLRDGSLESRDDRARFRNYIRVFSDAFQTFIFTRQAMCRESRYSKMFNEHLVEEIGHNKMLAGRADDIEVSDPILRATSSWFCHQMIVLDNVEKTIVNVALETAGYHFHTIAQPTFADDDCANYFASHAEGDEHHKDVGRDMLEGQSPEVYARLHAILDDAWDMLGAMTSRIADLMTSSQ